MPIKLNTASGGGVILTGANTASDKTITVPAVDGTMLTTASTFACTGPAFSAYASGSQTISIATSTKIQINTEDFDTANCFDSTTNYRFTPNVAGYYQINSTMLFASSGTSTGSVRLDIYKNGSLYALQTLRPQSGANSTVAYSGVIYMNGTTDYLEMYGYTDSNTTFSTTSVSRSITFSGALVRAA